MRHVYRKNQHVTFTGRTWFTIINTSRLQEEPSGDGDALRIQEDSLLNQSCLQGEPGNASCLQEIPEIRHFYREKL